ncbi:MAG: hypothetical protein GAK29_03822 [Acinetobacter bereziniae]|uniref:PAS domain-containing protein n=1 Tax=Acinetobacter bereziniae TaxID=106648 RepID=A0A833PC99_ACIBZ|nr:MAG: hypothetical protein GAK29_03822 [Acinetobacter bereziniae]
MNALDDGVYITDHLGTTLFVNDAYLKLTHLNREDLIDHPIQDLVNQGVFSRSVSMDVIQTHQKTTIFSPYKIILNCWSQDILYLIRKINSLQSSRQFVILQFYFKRKKIKKNLKIFAIHKRNIQHAS